MITGLEALRYEERGDVATITLARPPDTSLR